jgi:DNA-directed RNA polymerase specialized sigma24 family protein
LNRIELPKKHQALRKNPAYIKDWQEWQYIEDDEEWEARGQALRKKYGVKKLPNPFYDPQKRAEEKIWPAQRTSKKHIPPETFYRARMEGIREDDPPEVKVYSALYQEDRRRKKRWEIDLTPEDLNTLDALAGDALAKGKGEKDKKKLAKIWERYENRLAEVIEVWARQHSQLASGMFQAPSKKEERKRREWMLTMGFVSLKDFKLPILPQYPFGHYFLTINIFAKLYGLSPLVADAIFSRMSEVYQQAKKGERLPGEAVEPSKKKRTERAEAEQEEINKKFLSPAQILSEQHDKYVEVMGTLSHQVGREILNLEAYLHDCFGKAYRRSAHGEERPWSRKSDLSSEELEETPGPKESNLTPAGILDGKDAQERMAEWRQKFREATSFSQRQKDILMMKQTGFTVEDIADKIGVHPDTVDRDLRKLRSNPVLKELEKQYKEISDDIDEVAPYRRPQRRLNERRICPTCKLNFAKGDTNEECPFCHSELPRVPIK